MAKQARNGKTVPGLLLLIFAFFASRTAGQGAGCYWAKRCLRCCRAMQRLSQLPRR